LKNVTIWEQFVKIYFFNKINVIC